MSYTIITLFAVFFITGFFAGIGFITVVAVKHQKGKWRK